MENYISEENGKGKSHFIFDTLSIAQRLESAGYSRKQARAQAEIWRDSIENGLATREDLLRFKEELESKICGVSQDLQHTEKSLLQHIRHIEKSLLEKIKHTEEKLQREITISSRNIVFYLTVVFSAIEVISRFFP